MKKSLTLTLLVIAGLMLFSLASCGSSEREYADTATEDYESAVDNPYEYEDDYYAYEDVYEDVQEVVSVFKPFPIYTDGRSPDNHYVPSGYMGDHSDIAVERSSFEDPHGGTTCIKIVYSNLASQGARWVGMYWQNPANNWGDREGGYDLTGATKLVFWAKG